LEDRVDGEAQSLEVASKLKLKEAVAMISKYVTVPYFKALFRYSPRKSGGNHQKTLL
jgi:hypothetical protein